MPLLDKVEHLVKQFAQQAVSNSPILEQLEQQKETLETQIQQAELIAEAEIDEKLLQGRGKASGKTGS